jgi:hypothetical protein
MTFVGSVLHHIPSEPEGEQTITTTCLYCGENWPCEPVLIKRQVIALVLEKVQPKGPQPQCCDLHADRHTTLEDLAEEIKEI